MKFFTDDYFCIGQAHLGGGKPCQDYALSGSQEKMAYAIISDGCSSGGKTDVGARILALVTAKTIQEYWNLYGDDKTKEQMIIRINYQQKIILAGIQEVLGVNSNDLLATCVYAFVSDTFSFLQVLGDGVVAVKYKDGQTIVHNFEWGGNMPCYPSYQGDILDKFVQTQNLNSKQALKQKSWIIDEYGNKFLCDTKDYSAIDGISGVTLPIEDFDEVEFVSVFSDGVLQVDGVDWLDVVKEFLAFKNTGGVFVKRRVIRSVKELQKIGKGPMDDIAVATIGFAKEE